ncbi:hypothetical protein OHB12_02375 [Nocardia sp. NBC_01730]|uniref:hypothetical protein n=1 Tax=Nocardia sp. NBC_01730 TaxID=2975998 RepID=UPI002E132C74|nr:hypothetical protein OHB12_02375 [Nocardia sp. NBC_01730]
MSWYPSLKVGGDGSGVVSQAGAVALLRTAVTVGLDRALSAALSPWRKPLARIPRNSGRLEPRFGS